MKPYPIELRVRLVAAVDQGESVAQVACRFGVSQPCVRDLLQLRQQTDSLKPRPNPGGHPPAVPKERHDELRQLIKDHPDLTLAEIRDRLGLSCSQAAICRTLQKLQLVRKKKRFTPASSSARTS